MYLRGSFLRIACEPYRGTVPQSPLRDALGFGLNVAVPVLEGAGTAVRYDTTLTCRGRACEALVAAMYRHDHRRPLVMKYFLRSIFQLQ